MSPSVWTLSKCTNGFESARARMPTRLRLHGPHSQLDRRPRNGADKSVKLTNHSSPKSNHGYNDHLPPESRSGHDWHSIGALLFSASTYFTISEAKKGHFTPLLAQTIQPSLRIEEAVSSGLYYAIYCSEDHPRLSEKTEFWSRVQWMCSTPTRRMTFAGNWNRSKSNPTFEPISSEVPVLLVSGARDPVTPPILAERAGKTFSKAQYIVAPQAAHNVGMERCAAGLLGRLSPIQLRQRTQTASKRPKPNLGSQTHLEHSHDQRPSNRQIIWSGPSGSLG